ncbi:hypothetical protein MsAc7_10470 [Methanolapillus millepedarum]|uniref:Uncharacterized protein n=2 Tax=Methanolapillus millepedarum TaxID=3028296 RepID=A0AA96V3Y1_9EURY|nr:hypothetical protein MsAc7_10470 [Methanosarcinaceae archaeon Ac7]
MKTNFKILVIGVFLIGISLLGLGLLSNFPLANGDSVFSTTSNASVPYYTYEELNEKSDLIVYGTIIEISDPKWSTVDGEQPKGVYKEKGVTEKGEECVYYYFNLQPDERIYTDMTFLVEECYKGDVVKSEKIIIRSFGGIIGEFKMNDVEHLNPEDFKKGDKILLYLREDTGTIKDIGPTHYVILTPRGKLSLNGEILINADGEKISLDEVRIN